MKDIVDFNIEHFDKKPLDKMLEIKTQRLQKSIKLLKEHKPGRLLDIGCGPGEFGSVFVKSGWDVYGIDASKKLLRVAEKKGLKTRFHDISKRFPFKENTFDAIFAGEIIEHVPDAGFFLDECYRILKRNGLLVLTTPNLLAFSDRWRMLRGKDPKYYSAHLKEPGHVRLYTFGSIQKHLRSHNFKIDKVVGDVIIFPLLYRAIGETKRLSGTFPKLCKTIIVKARK